MSALIFGIALGYLGKPYIDKGIAAIKAKIGQ